MRQKEIKEKILKAPLCLVLETTTSLNRVTQKIFEVQSARNYINLHTGKRPYAGLVFWRNTDHIGDARSLEAITQINEFNEVVALAALEQAANEAYTSRDADVAEQLWCYVVEGENLDNFLYVSPRNWRAFREKYPDLIPEAETCKRYFELIGQTKGSFIQTYVEQAIKAQVPDAEIIRNHEYHPRNSESKLDIDLIVLGEHDPVLAAIGNPEYFKKVRLHRDVKRAYRRYSGRLQIVA